MGEQMSKCLMGTSSVALFMIFSAISVYADDAKVSDSSDGIYEFGNAAVGRSISIVHAHDQSTPGAPSDYSGVLDTPFGKPYVGEYFPVPILCKINGKFVSFSNRRVVDAAYGSDLPLKGDEYQSFDGEIFTSAEQVANTGVFSGGGCRTTYSRSISSYISVDSKTGNVSQKFIKKTMQSGRRNPKELLAERQTSITITKSLRLCRLR